MSYYFDNNSRYQIIYPYTSDKIHVEPSVDHGAYRCYQELKDRDIITYIFIVHDIDAGTLYYFNIPKNKHLDVMDAKDRSPRQLPGQSPQTIHPISQNTTNNFKPGVTVSVPEPGIQSIQSLPTQQMNTGIPTNQPIQSINIINPAHQPVPINTQPDYNLAKQNEIITRLNHVEYQLDTLKKKVYSLPKKEEEGCVVM